MSPASELRLIKRSVEFIPKSASGSVPKYTRGIYVLFAHNLETGNYDVVYVGLAGGVRAGVRNRLLTHNRSKKKAGRWTHFSFFEVWDNIREEEVRELEGLFRHIYRRDAQANALNVQRSYRKLRKVRKVRDKDLERRLTMSRTLRGWRSGWEHEATLRRNGTVQYGNQIYESPSAAGRAAAGTKCNGWNFWHYRNNKGEWVPLRTLR